MTKRYFLVFLLLIALLTACEIELDDSTSRYGSVTLNIEDATEVRSILPVYPAFYGYEITLTNTEEIATTYTNKFQKGTNITFSEVLIGTYNISVKAYSDDEYSNLIAEGTSSFNVTATTDNKATVSLDWLDEGTGSFSVTIDWENLTNNNNLISMAVESGSLGFQAWDTTDNKAFNGAAVQYADTKETSYTYTQSGIPTTKETRSKNISFRIYSKGEVIAETFNTTVTILPNIESKPDGNEIFSFNDNNLIYYLKNVTDVKASLNEEDSAANIDISWSYPVLSDGDYVLTAWITNNSDNNILVGEKQTFSYSMKNGVTESTKSTTFTGLVPGNIYTIHFLNETDKTKETIYSYSVEKTPLTDIKTKVKVQSIAFPTGFSTSYVMGDSATVSAVISPDNATYKGYTITVQEGVTLSDSTVTFPSSGDYTITLTSEDENAVNGTADLSVTVKLAVPTGLTIAKADNGFSLNWNAVNGATGYVIEKKYGNATEELSSSTTTYLDSDVKTGVDYTYKVKAVREDVKFDSSYSDTTVTANITNSVITITEPKDVERVDYKTLLDNALYRQYVTDSTGISLNIDTVSSLLSGASSYSWYLNGVTLGTNTTSLSISAATNGLNVSTTESSNTLQLTVTKGDYTYSASTTLHYIDVDPGEVTIVGDKEINGENSTITLTARSDNENAVILWSSSDTSVATVSSTGVVTAINDGKVTITATVAATGKSATYEITSYISTLTFTNAPTNFLVKDGNGVTVSNDNYKTRQLKLNSSTIKAGDNPSYVWDSSNRNVATVDQNGNLTLVGGGTTTITVTKNGAPSVSCEVTVYRFDIYSSDKNSIITGNEQVKLSGGTVFKYPEYTFTIAINNTNLSSNSSIADFDWEKAVEEHGNDAASLTSNNYYSVFKIKETIATFTITVTIKNKSGNKIGTMYFKRVS